MRLRQTVFIAHAADAKTFARSLAARLRMAGFNVFFDERSLRPSEAYDVAIEDAAKTCSLFIFVVSAGSVVPDAYALTELSWAVSSERTLLGVHGPGHDEIEAPADISAATCIRGTGDRAASTVSEVRRLLHRSGTLRILSAVVVLVAVGATILFLNRPRQQTDSVSTTAVGVNSTATELSESQNHASDTDRQAAQQAAAAWLAALKTGDIAAVEELSTTPFYFDNEVLLSKKEIKSSHERLFAKRAQTAVTDWQVDSIKASTLAELSAAGKSLGRDRVVSNLSMSSTDWLVTVTMSNDERREGVAIFVRIVESKPRVVGVWD